MYNSKHEEQKTPHKLVRSPAIGLFLNHKYRNNIFYMSVTADSKRLRGILQMSQHSKKIGLQTYIEQMSL